MSETIYMIHGMCGGSWTWEKYIEFFEQRGFNCVATTLRYHDMDPGDEPDPRLGTTSLIDYSEDLEREITAMEQRPVIMGHSMGGLLAQILAARGLPGAAVLLAPASPAGIFALKPSVIKSFWSMQVQWGFWKKPVRQTFDEAVYSMLHKLPSEEQRDVYNRFVYESGRAVSEIGYWFFDPKGASSVDESKVNCPVLIIAGSEDRVTPEPIVHRVARKYIDVTTYKEFDGHGHWLVGEPGWQEVAEYVADWLSGTKR